MAMAELRITKNPSSDGDGRLDAGVRLVTFEPEVLVAEGEEVRHLRIDPQGKAFAQQLLEFPVPVPSGLVKD